MRKTKVKSAHLVYGWHEETDEYGNYVNSHFTLTRFSNPVVSGEFTSKAWFSMPVKVEKDVQSLANEKNEVIYDAIRDRYVYPKEKEVNNLKKRDVTLVEKFALVEISGDAQDCNVTLYDSKDLAVSALKKKLYKIWKGDSVMIEKIRKVETYEELEKLNCNFNWGENDIRVFWIVKV